MPRHATPITLHLRSNSEQETMQIASALAKLLRTGDVVALEGPLGSGKTCFVRGLAQGLGLNPRSVSSPTFVICHEYSSDDDRDHEGRTPALIHVDAYRLSGPQELETIGWNEMLQSGEAVIAVEWPSRIAAALPVGEGRIDVVLEHAGEHSRKITITGAAAIIDNLKQVEMRRDRFSTDGSDDTDSLKGIQSGPVAKRDASTSSIEPQSGQRSASAQCRTCGEPVDAAAAGTFPFCSDRCRLADLGRWFNESYRASRAAEADEELNE